MKNGIHKFNHLVKGIPNTEENRDEVKRINKQAKKSKSRWRLGIKYRKPKAGVKWGWGGTVSCENAEEFAVYVRDQIPWSNRPENESYQRMCRKYSALLQKHNMRELKGIVKNLLTDVEDLSYVLERGDSNGEVKWDMIFRSLDSLKCNLDKDLENIEKY